MEHFLGFFEGASTFFYPKIALRYAQDNLGVKKVSAPRKTPPNALYVLPAEKK